MVFDYVSRQTIGMQAKEIINECLERLKENEAPDDFITKAETSFKATFMRWYNQTLANLIALGKVTKNPLFFLSYKEITGVVPKESKGLVISLGEAEGFEIGSIKNIREFITTGEKGYSQAFIEDYQKRVNQEIRNIANKNLVMLDKNGRRLSIRNLAEMQVRFEEIEKDADRLRSQGVDFAYATSHINASERCQIWQGKLFILDTKVGSSKPGAFIRGYQPKSVGKIDGIEYYSLLDAINHGFLGYNCRHRLVAYKKGMTKSREYNARSIDNERNKEQYLRAMENNIRKAKRGYVLATSKEERSFYQNRSIQLQKDYDTYCRNFNYPIARWRTRVSLDERNALPNLSYNAKDGKTYGEFVNGDK